MSSLAVQNFVSRAVKEEGLRLLAYDDKTGKTVHAPVGKLTWGIGFNLETCGSPGLFAVMLSYLCDQIEPQLIAQPWYADMGDPMRQSVFVDVAYNAGVHGELTKWPNAIKAAGLKDWPTCAAQLTVAEPGLNASRYAPLRKILLGNAP